MEAKYDVLVIGGGTGGIMTSAQVLEKDPSLKVGVIEPGDTHYYQPAFTLVGAGTYDMKKTARPMKDVMPDKVTWIKDKAVGFKPKENKVSTEKNGDLEYKYLVVSPGLVMAPEMVEGLPEAMEKGIVCSNYTDPEHVWETLKNFKGGNAIFTQANTPIKCGGAPQKIAYLSADYIRNKIDDKKSNILFATPGTVIFGVTEVAETLHKVLDRYNMDLKTYLELVRIDPENKKVYYNYIGEEKEVPGVEEGNKYGAKLTENNLIEIPFEMLHL
ncbi:MAG TPA: FAD/NAD(P)-binding oxidoreductase, partial [Bacteroidales bacterium]|nr:FAD/NAD(P)-binding oxidoreductase [Bacteroidales bacterium]